MDLAERLVELLRENGACDVGFAQLADGPCGLRHAVSIVVPLSDAVVDEIDGAPTHAYFHHYRTVNAHIDRLILLAGLALSREGYRYYPIAASQSIHTGGERAHRGRYSHKKAAVCAGLGTVGKSTLFLHRRFGARVRLGTLFTDCPLAEKPQPLPVSPCGACGLCVRACPAGAIKGETWTPEKERSDLFDAEACNRYMREHFMKIGRGAVCGICMRVCRASSRTPGDGQG